MTMIFSDFYSENISMIKQKIIVIRLKTPIAVKIFSDDGIMFDQSHRRVSSSIICKFCMDKTRSFIFYVIKEYDRGVELL